MASSAKKLSKNYRLAATAALIFSFAVFYLGTNHFSIFSAHTLPLFDWEKSIPFLPGTVIFYLLAYLQVILVFYLADKPDLKKIFRGMLGLIIFHGLFFFFYPTAYPRPSLPLDTSVLSRLGYQLIIFFDKSGNCFPSLHVALSLFSSLALGKKSLSLKITFFIITALAVASTLTLKQHYFVDILGGLATAIIFYGIFIYEPRRKD